jgi:endoglucanase
MEVDAMGNLICVKRAGGPRVVEGDDGAPQKVMVACHMDEIAFIVRHVDDDGFIRLQHLGGFDARNLFARRVRIQTRDGSELYGNMNFVGRPIHIAKPEERKKVPELNELFVDTGLDVEEVRERVHVGDPVTMVQDFVEMGDLCSGKCLDNRVACWVGLRLLQQLESSAYDLYVVFTVQEEIGVRGATTSSYAIEPDIGIAIDTTLAVDIPGVGVEERITALGEGVAIKVMDSYTVSDKRLVDGFMDLAEAREISFQLEILPLGGTDAGPIQRARSGCRAITLSVPTRYIHTVTETIHRKDLEATLSLLRAFCEEGEPFEGR